jgi:hypothetical protein
MTLKPSRLKATFKKPIQPPLDLEEKQEEIA